MEENQVPGKEDKQQGSVQNKSAAQGRWEKESAAGSQECRKQRQVLVSGSAGGRAVP